jgi:peptidoglycan glycosyltransferase
MQTTLARRQRHRRLGIRQRPRGSSALKRTAIALPFILFVVFASAGALGLLGVAAAYTYYANGLPNPEAALTDSRLRSADDRHRPDRQDRARQARRAKAPVVTFTELTPEILDATTAIEDKDFWDNPGFDFAGFVSATVDTINGRPRGARRSPSSSSECFCRPARSTAAAKSARSANHPVGPAHPGVPGEKGKQQIITAYLNQNFYGNQSYGVKAAAASTSARTSRT